jgi:DNA-binding MarR family transcriptional regulator
MDDPDDRRAMIIRMTPQGKAWFEQVAAEHERWLDEWLGRLPASDMEGLYHSLGHLRVVLSEGQS